jgi:predicted permease
VAVGFATLFSNAVLLGLPITERAWGAEALGPNFAIIAVHAPFCYTLGVTAMEFARADGKGVLATLASVLRAMARNPLVIGIGLGAIVNLTGLPIPGALSEAVDLIARAALPVALFGLGGILVRYRPEGDMRLVGWIMAVSLGLHPAVVWLMGTALDLTPDQFRSAVLTAAMAPGVNAYIFANMYGVAKRVAATAVLAATTASILSVWLWLGILG